MINSGMGHTHVETLLTTMGIPAMSHSTMKRREREVAPAISKTAKAACDAALKAEVEATTAANE